MENLDDNKIDRIEMVDLQVEMARSYLDYAMSVIVGRALPDIRDGLRCGRAASAGSAHQFFR